MGEWTGRQERAGKSGSSSAVLVREDSSQDPVTVDEDEKR